MASCLALASSEPTIVLQFAAERKARLSRMRGEQSPFISNARFAEAWSILDDEGVVSLRKINQAAADSYNVSYIDLISPRLERAFVLARYLAIYVAKTVTPSSYPMIGRHMGKRDHTGVLRGFRRAQEIYKSDQVFAHKADFLVAKFSGI